MPALVLLASITVSMLASSSAPTPLYAVYQREWGFSSITTTLVFGIYAVSVLVSLLVLGKLSDFVGRRPVLLAALMAQAAAMVVFAEADGVAVLTAARVVQGLATGAALGAVGAAMLDVDPKRGTLANAVSPGTGTAVGALISGLTVRYLPAPTQFIYFLLLAVFVAQAVGVLLIRETSEREPGALGSLVPEIRLPRVLHAPMLAAGPVLFAIWALAGLYGALGPALVSVLTGSASVVLGGLSLFTLAGVAMVAVVLLRQARPGVVMLTGIAALVAGVIVTLAGLHMRSTAVFFVGTAIAGVGFGAGFQGSIRTLVPLAAPHERSGVLSVIFVISYLGLGVPAVAAGWLAVHGRGLIGAANDYAVVLIALAVIAVAALANARRRTKRAASAELAA
jgi:MFS family permease